MGSPTIKERLESYPFSTYVGAGAAIGLLAVALAVALGRPDGSSASVKDAKSQDAKASAHAAAGGVGGHDGGAYGAGGRGADEHGGGGGGGGGHDSEADDGGGGGDDDADRADGDGYDEGDDAERAEGGDDAADDGDDDAADGDDDAADGDDDDPAPAEGQADREVADTDADRDADEAPPARPAAAEGGEDEVELDDAGAPTPTPPIEDSNRAAEASMTAEELYEAAKKEYEEGDYRDAFRLSTRSYYKERRTETQVLRGKSACALKDEKAAKEIVKSFKLTDPKRKELREHCKTKGVRVGI